MTEHDLSGRTALVTGASRGFGRATSTVLAGAGARVIGVARTKDRLDELRAELGGEFVAVCADVTDPTVAGQLIDAYRPDVLVLNAGASPLSRPIHLHTWQTFSRTWEVDVQHVFHWTREALLRPLRPGSVVVAMSSGAALGGSPISGGYAGAKAAIRFLTGYAAQESQRAGLGIRFSALLPSLTPGTALSDAALAGYAERQGVELGEFLGNLGPVLTRERVAGAVARLAGDPALDAAAYTLSPDGLAAIDG
ncbi:SDR family oxidoreductase [Winogradskya consettensis]|uniref:Short-chain dehydrogenase n=1 Tax=Winogradskya consettensis TaxID=113560 RepID=A0A919VQ86_9ACTN|nr:SDR family oxidoreductase [Actinoplanes consettensis]GIM74649.1 short-chain dehydrogenase [Actinoplanes consettensis]